MGVRRNAYRVLMGKPEERGTLGRQGCRWVDNIKMGIREKGWHGVDWIDMAQDRQPVESSCKHGIEP
jgi:hypothetical protein